MSANLAERKVDVRTVKSLVCSILPKDHPLRASFEVEDDIMSAEEFIAKATLWLRLSRSS
jgi:hypothetical protein